MSKDTKLKCKCGGEYKHFDFRNVGNEKFEIIICKECGNKKNIRMKEGTYGTRRS